MAKIIVVVKAILTRIIFATHGFIAIWRATSIKRDPYYWYLSASLLALSFEMVFTLTIKKNQEWKWFCPSVFFYLCSVVPAIWLIEVDKFDKRMLNITRLASAGGGGGGGGGGMGMGMGTGNATMVAKSPINAVNIPTPAGPLAPISFQGVNLEIPVALDEEMWATVIEQLLMLILIIGRWMLPKGGLTRDQLSQLLLVYIGTAADIIEFFDSFKDEKIAQNRVLCLLILSIWSWSLLQFTFVLTATKSRRTRITGVEQQQEKPKAKLKNGIIKVKEVCCSIDVWAILINIILQDAPFLIFRMLLITYYRIISYMNIFFTCKNTLVIILQFYRLFVVQMEKKKELSKALKSGVSGNLVKAIGQAAFLGRQAEAARRAAANKASGSKRAVSAGPSTKQGVSKKHRSQESISSRNTRCSDAPPRSDRVKSRRKSLSTGNLRSVNDPGEDAYLEVLEDDLEVGVSGSVISGTNDQDSQEDDSEDVPIDDVSLASERPNTRRKIRMSENPGVYKISGSRSSAASSDRDRVHYRQDTGYSSSSKDSGNSSRRDRIVRHGGGNGGGGNRSRSKSSAQQRKKFLVNSRHLNSADFLEDFDLETETQLSPAEDERI